MDAKRFAELVHSLREAGRVARGERKPALWFRLPNPLLGDVSPRDMIRYGRLAKLREFVVEALAMTRARFTDAGR
jgi:hypothetical protein